MLYTLFFSRFRPDLAETVSEEYLKTAQALRAKAGFDYPGFVDQKTYVAEDGERLTIVRFDDAESHRAWSRDGEHVDAKKRGREAFYDHYEIVVCEPVRHRVWHASDAAAEAVVGDQAGKGAGSGSP